jgi:hypothetical protein
MQDAGYRLPRISIPRTLVNKVCYRYQRDGEEYAGGPTLEEEYPEFPLKRLRKFLGWRKEIRNSSGHPPPGIRGAGPIVGPPESNRLGLGCGVGLGERVGSGVGDALAVAVSLAVGEVPAAAVALPAVEPAAPAQLSTVTVYCLS